MRWTLTLGAILLATVALAADWPQWLGPTRDGVSSEKVAPWKDELKPKWSAKVAEGHSSPVVANGVVYLHTREAGNDAETLHAFKSDTGEVVFSKSYPRGPFASVFGIGPRATPAVHEGHVYSLGVTGILTCITADKGEIKWQKDTLKEFGAKNLFFGVSSSPLIVGDTVLVNVGGKGASIVAFKLASGEVAWKIGDDPASYASPILIDKGKRAVFLTQNNLLGVDPVAGKIEWSEKFKDKALESSTTPVVVKDMLIASSVTLGTAAFKLSNSGLEQVWLKKELPCYFSTPIAVGDSHLFMVVASKEKKVAAVRLVCVELQTGNVVWEKKGIGSFHAALLRTGDGNLLLHEDTGALRLLAPDVKEYRELAKGQVTTQTWAHPALANGYLYVRDSTELKCFALDGK